MTKKRKVDFATMLGYVAGSVMLILLFLFVSDYEKNKLAQQEGLKYSIIAVIDKNYPDYVPDSLEWKCERDAAVLNSGWKDVGRAKKFNCKASFVDDKKQVHKFEGLCVLVGVFYFDENGTITGMGQEFDCDNFLEVKED